MSILLSIDGQFPFIPLFHNIHFNDVIESSFENLDSYQIPSIRSRIRLIFNGATSDLVSNLWNSPVPCPGSISASITSLLAGSSGIALCTYLSGVGLVNRIDNSIYLVEVEIFDLSKSAGNKPCFVGTVMLDFNAQHRGPL